MLSATGLWEAKRLKTEPFTKPQTQPQPVRMTSAAESIRRPRRMIMHRSAGKSLAWPRRKQTTATKDSEFHISKL